LSRRNISRLFRNFQLKINAKKFCTFFPNLINTSLFFCHFERGIDKPGLFITINNHLIDINPICRFLSYFSHFLLSNSDFAVSVLVFFSRAIFFALVLLLGLCQFFHCFSEPEINPKFPSLGLNSVFSVAIFFFWFFGFWFFVLLQH